MNDYTRRKFLGLFGVSAIAPRLLSTKPEPEEMYNDSAPRWEPPPAYGGSSHADSVPAARSDSPDAPWVSTPTTVGDVGLWINGKEYPFCSHELEFHFENPPEIRADRALQTMFPPHEVTLNVETYADNLDDFLSDPSRTYAVELKTGPSTIRGEARLRNAQVLAAAMDQDMTVAYEFVFVGEPKLTREKT